jgi:hypothetical protein
MLMALASALSMSNCSTRASDSSNSARVNFFPQPVALFFVRGPIDTRFIEKRLVEPAKSRACQRDAPLDPLSYVRHLPELVVPDAQDRLLEQLEPFR